ncbi:probable nucleoside diphosphate kinase 5 isoform X2 [Magnolia sinica]|uniref:probable nucleoside diphosphate kinase 5 isoform X2 n=1 Tax=Magnolia sinica TaxID=86752 RepID=UPI00265B7052|nr:probable nucleoside diphosphate kinase 5 isoform X2 [Magnolia sinica]
MTFALHFLHFPASSMGKLSLLLLVSIFLLLSFPTEASVEKEKTLAIIKPDGLFGNYTDKIKTIILESGFSILREMTLQLNESDVALFYAEHSGRSFFPSIVNYMTSYILSHFKSYTEQKEEKRRRRRIWPYDVSNVDSPVSIMVLEKANAIVDWRVLIGPTDARKARLSHPGRRKCCCT